MYIVTEDEKGGIQSIGEFFSVMLLKDQKN